MRPTVAHGGPPADDAPTLQLRATPPHAVPVARAAPPSGDRAAAGAPAARATSARRPAPVPDARHAPDRRNGLGTPALVLGALAAGTAYFASWAGVVLGLFAVAVGFMGARRAWLGAATDGASSLGGLALGLVGLVWGSWLVGQTLFTGGTFGDGLTLDQCLAGAPTAKEQHMCKSQHLQEFNQRFPGAAT